MKNYPTIVPVVSVALLREDGTVLVQKRRNSGAHGGLWEFPGGKIEPDETPESALVREISEELDCTICVGSLEPLAFASDPRTPEQSREPYLILLYLCRNWVGEPRCVEAEAIGWFAPDALDALAMPPLDRPLAAALRRRLGAPI